MRALRWLVVCASLSLLPACTAILRFDQCRIDADCPQSLETPAYCTADNICATDYPAERIDCRIDVAGSNASGAMSVGALIDISGPNRQLDATVLDAARLAVSEINQAISAGNNPQQRPLHFVVCDTNGITSHAYSALNVLARQHGVVAVVGPSTAEQVFAVAPAAKARNVVVVTSEAGAAAIDDLDDGGFVWRIAPPDTLQTKVLAAFVPTTTMRPTLAYTDDAYGQSVQSAMLAQISAQHPGLPTTMRKPIPLDAFESASAPALAAAFLNEKDADTGILIGDTDLASWIKAIALAPPPSLTKLLVTDRARTSALLAVPNPALLGLVTGTSLALDSGAHVDAFSAAWTAAYPTAAAAGAREGRAYDAIYSIALAGSIIPAGRRAFGDGVRQGMLRVSVPGQSAFRVGPADFDAAYGSIADGFAINLNGVSGPIDFDKDTGDVPTAPVQVWTVDTTVPAAPVFKASVTTVP